MIPIRLTGNNIILAITYASCLILFSCSTTGRFQESNHVVNEFNSYYQNDSLKLSLRYPGDYAFANTLDKKDFQEFNKYFQKKTGISLKKRDFVYQCSTIIEPFLHSALFLVNKEAISPKTLETDFHRHKQDSIQFFQRMDTIGNAESNWSLRFYPYEQHYLAFVTYAKKADDPYHIMESEFNDFVFPSIRMGANYKYKAPQNPFSIGFEAFKQDSVLNYLLPIKKLSSVNENYTKLNERSDYIQAALTFNSFIENSPHYNALLAEWNSIMQYDKVSFTENESASLIYDSTALFSVLDIAKKNQVLMFNESHFVPKHRLLITYLLEDFYNVGYRYLALEALSAADSMLNKRGYPINPTGFYTSEPTYGKLIRQALQLGFTLIPYDEKEPHREKKQAENIYNRTLKVNGEAKVLVLAGFDHINERYGDGKQKRMAAYFKEITGIDPITVNQVRFESQAKNLKNKKIALLHRENLTNHDEYPNDLFLINHLEPNDARSYLNNGNRWKELDIQPYLQRYGSAASLFVYDQKEYVKYGKNAIPYVIRLIESSIEDNFVQIPNGEYILIIKDKYEDPLYEEKLKIKF